jgi:ATP-binding cassette subfamily C protein
MDIIGRLGRADTDQVITAAKLAGLHEIIMRLPKAYESDVAEGSLVLLRGHRQRLGLARAFCGTPRLVVLDEPNASLDYLGEQTLLNAVQTLKSSNTTVIIITHRTGILSATDKIAIMQGGALGAFGTRDDIFARYIGQPQVPGPEIRPVRGALPTETDRDHPPTPARSIAARRRSKRTPSTPDKAVP